MTTARRKDKHLNSQPTSAALVKCPNVTSISSDKLTKRNQSPHRWSILSQSEIRWTTERALAYRHAAKRPKKPSAMRFVNASCCLTKILMKIGSLKTFV